MADTPVIQILDKEHYHTQELVPLPNALPYPPLGPSSIRLRTKVLGLSLNNFTYARFGFLLGWWDVHPLPPSTPAPFNDATKYGRINAWGFMEVLDSTLPSVPAGSFLWGYLPIGTLAQDLQAKDAGAPGQVLITSEARAKTMSVYNRYFVYPASIRADIEARAEWVAYDVVVRVMFETAYLIALYAFAPKPEQAIPSIATMNKTPWTAQRANLQGATVVILAPGAKVALTLAHLLKTSDHGAKRIVAAPSEQSVDFVRGLSTYDDVVLTSESPEAVLSHLGVKSTDKLVLFDCGGRDQIGSRWSAAFAGLNSNFLHIPIGSGSTEVPAKEVVAAYAKPAPGYVQRVSASDLREEAIARDGEVAYFEGLEAAWRAFRERGIPGFRVKWGEGMEDVKEGWDAIAGNKVSASEALVYLV